MQDRCDLLLCKEKAGRFSSCFDLVYFVSPDYSLCTHIVIVIITAFDG